MTDFPEFWSTYPHPTNRGDKRLTERLYNMLTAAEREDMLAAMSEYAVYCANEAWYHAMMAQRWVNPKNQGLWEPWLEQAQERAESDARAEGIRQEREQKRAERRRIEQEEAAEAERSREGNLVKIENYLRQNGVRR